MRASQLNVVIEEMRHLLSGDKTGHSDAHVMRTYNISINLCEKERADKEIVALAALLHDVDDYKIFGQKSADELTNAYKIMNESGIKPDMQVKVAEIIKTMGYSKLLTGVRPTTIEGKIVSDADMCDGIGVNGILRWHEFAICKGQDLFSKAVFPTKIVSVDDYKSTSQNPKGKNYYAIEHVFEKLLKLESLMLTKSGKKEAKKRQRIMVDFLREFFRENDAPDWNKYLDDYLMGIEGTLV